MLEPDWKGYPAVIVATGHSFTAAQARLVAMARAKDLIRVIAVNDAVYPCWFADIAYAADSKWWKYHRGLPGFPSRKMKIAVMSESGVDTNGVDYPDVECIEKAGNEGFASNPRITSAGSGGGQALQIAVHLGADPIVLIGFDMHGGHFFGDHPESIATHPDMQMRIRRFLEMHAVIHELGIRVVNASPGSSLDIPRADLGAELQKIEDRYEQAGPRG